MAFPSFSPLWSSSLQQVAVTPATPFKHTHTHTRVNPQSVLSLLSLEAVEFRLLPACLGWGMEKVKASRMVTGTNEQEGGQFVPVPSCRSHTHTHGELQFDRLNAYIPVTLWHNTSRPDWNYSTCFQIAVFLVWWHVMKPSTFLPQKDEAIKVSDAKIQWVIFAFLQMVNIEVPSSLALFSQAFS